MQLELKKEPSWLAKRKAIITFNAAASGDILLAVFVQTYNIYISILNVDMVRTIILAISFSY